MDDKAPFIVLMFLGMFAGIAWIAGWSPRTCDLAEKAAYAGGGLAAVAVLAALWPELKAWAEPLVAAPGQGLQATPLLTVTLWLVAAFGAASLLVAIGVGSILPGRTAEAAEAGMGFRGSDDAGGGTFSAGCRS